MSYVRYTERERAERARKIVDLRRHGARVRTIAELMEVGLQTVMRCLRAHGMTDKSHRQRGSW